MKVLIVSLSNTGGGAARAINGLTEELQKRGVDFSLLLMEGKNGANTHIITDDNPTQRLVFRLKNKTASLLFSLFANPSHDYRSANIFHSRLLQIINHSDADIVNFHWVGAEMISIKQMSEINKPVLWTLHDSWMLNGVYHVSPEDYVPFQDLPEPNWLEQWVKRRKKKYLSRVPMHLTVPSAWMKKRYLHSFLNKPGNSCDVVRNIINPNDWQPMDKNAAQERLGFDHHVTNVLFVARNVTTSFNKGYCFVKYLAKRGNGRFVFHLVGANEENLPDNIISHGAVNGNLQLSTYYSASDICIVPSFSESMSYVALESILCNTPVLCFDGSGPSEVVRHGVNGYIAKRYEEEDLFRGLEYLIAHPLGILRDTIPDYMPELNLERYLNLYKKMMSYNTTSGV